MAKSWEIKDEELRQKLLDFNSKKRQQTEWLWTSLYESDTYIRVGLIHNKNKRDPYDVIVTEVLNEDKEVLRWEMRLDEAQTLITGLSKTLTYILLDMGNKGKFLHQHYEYFEMNRHKK